MILSAIPVSDKVPHRVSADAGEHFFAHQADLMRILIHFRHNSPRKRAKTSVVRRKEVFYTQVQLFAETALPCLVHRFWSGNVKPCVAIGERTFLSRRADNTVIRERRRQSCPPPSKHFWPLAFSPLQLLALSKKKSSWLSRSWKKSPCPSTDSSVSSGAPARTRQNLAHPTGGRP